MKAMSIKNLILTCLVIATIAGCGAATIKPRYTSTNPDVLRIGGAKPVDKNLKTINMGSYCLKVEEHWKADGQTPDGQTIWARDTIRDVIPCR